MPNLRKLKLSDCQSISGVLGEISELSNLEEMDFSASSINTKSLEQLLSKSPNLKKLNLTCCKKISGDLSRQFELSHLEELGLKKISINAELLGQLLSKTPNLKKLDLFGCRNVSGALGELHRLNSLEELNLSYSSINTELLGQLLSKMPNLKKLDLFGCRNISEALGEISEFKNLEVLDLSKSSINAESLGQLLSKMPNLKKLNLIDDMYLQKEKYEFQNKEEIECFIQKLRLQTKTENTPTFFQRMGSLVYNKSQLPPSDEQLSNHQPFQKTAASNETTKHHQSKAAVDADTKPQNSNLSVKKEFIRKTQRTHENVHPRNVRHDCFERLAFQDAKVPFLVLADAEKDIEVFIEATKSNQSLLPDFEKASVGSYLGRFSITLNHEWQPLPSVMPHEILQSYFCDINVDIEIAYSEQKNFYYVRLPSSVQQTSILSTIEVLLTPDAREVALPPEVQRISQTISNSSSAVNFQFKKISQIS